MALRAQRLTLHGLVWGGDGQGQGRERPGPGRGAGPQGRGCGCAGAAPSGLSASLSRLQMFVGLLFWFQFYCGFSASAMIDQWYLIFFNLLFSSLPQLVTGVLDKDVPADVLLTEPQFYKSGQNMEVSLPAPPSPPNSLRGTRKAGFNGRLGGAGHQHVNPRGRPDTEDPRVRVEDSVLGAQLFDFNIRASTMEFETVTFMKCSREPTHRGRQHPDKVGAEGLGLGSPPQNVAPPTLGTGTRVAPEPGKADLLVLCPRSTGPGPSG